MKQLKFAHNTTKDEQLRDYVIYLVVTRQLSKGSTSR